MTDVVEKLTRIRDRLSVPGQWIRLYEALDKHKQPVDPRSPKAVCWCLLGAWMAESAPDAEPDDASLAIMRVLPNGGLSMTTCNDSFRSVEPVLELLDRAIAAEVAA